MRWSYLLLLLLNSFSVSYEDWAGSCRLDGGGQIQSTEFLKCRNLNTPMCSSEPVVAGKELEKVWKCIWWFPAMLILKSIVLFFCVKTAGTSFELWLENSVRPRSFLQPMFMQCLAQCTMAFGYDMNNNKRRKNKKSQELIMRHLGRTGGSSC